MRPPEECGPRRNAGSGELLHYTVVELISGPTLSQPDPGEGP